MCSPTATTAPSPLTRPWAICACRSIIFCEAVAIYGVIVAIILQTKVEAVAPNADGSYNLAAANAGYAILGAGSVTGWANLVCGLSVGVVGSAAAVSDAANANLFVKVRRRGGGLLVPLGGLLCAALLWCLHPGPMQYMPSPLPPGADPYYCHFRIGAGSLRECLPAGTAPQAHPQQCNAVFAAALPHERSP